MRKIKFRGQRKDNGKWIYGYYIKTKDASWIIPVQEATPYPYYIYDNPHMAIGDAYEVIPKTVGQFTGMYDSTKFEELTKEEQGKEIYERDIIQYKTCFYNKEKTHIELVEWKDDLEHDGFGEPLAMGYIFRGYDNKILGNIHDNPELLKENIK